MNFVEEYIIGRRSVRSYKPDLIEQEKIDLLVKACFYAPSAMNKNQRELIILNDRKIIDEVASKQRYSAFAQNAPLAMVVCGIPGEIPGFWMDDCAASTENILIAARALGIGSCWCGVCHTDRVPLIRELLQIPSGVEPYSLIILGYAEKDGAPPARDLKTPVHYNGWNKQ